MEPSFTSGSPKSDSHAAPPPLSPAEPTCLASPADARTVGRVPRIYGLKRECLTDLNSNLTTEPPCRGVEVQGRVGDRRDSSVQAAPMANQPRRISRPWHSARVRTVTTTANRQSQFPLSHPSPQTIGEGAALPGKPAAKRQARGRHARSASSRTPSPIEAKPRKSSNKRPMVPIRGFKNKENRRKKSTTLPRWLIREWGSLALYERWMDGATAGSSPRPTRSKELLHPSVSMAPDRIAVISPGRGVT